MTHTQKSPRRRQVSALGAAGTLVGGAGSALLLALAASPASAVGTTFTVDTLDDGAPNGADCATPVVGSCSLRDALDAVVDGDSIVFASGLTGTIHLDRTQLEVDFEIEILGPGADVITIDAGGQSRVFYVCSGSDPATISGLTMTGGYADKGGAVYEESCGGVILREVVITGNDTTDYGGGVYANAELWIYDSEISGNTAPTYGGGVYAGSDLVIENSLIANNSTTDTGHGGGGVFSSSTTSIRNSSFIGNTTTAKGGGLYAKAMFEPIEILNSTFSGNGAAEGGGGAFVYTRAALSVANTTITANTTSSGGGGGLAVVGDSGLNEVRLDQVTITGNSALGNDSYLTGGGVHFSAYAVVFLSGAIISGNSSAAGADDVAMGLVNTSPNPSIDSNHSLLGDVAARITVFGSGNISSLTPGLAPLADNGGRTKTMALLAGSPALDAGPDPVAIFPGNENDQRGTGFARVINGRADIGAYEAQSTPLPTTTTTPSGPVVPTFTG